MNSQKEKPINFRRPRSTARDYNVENSNSKTLDKRVKTSKLPKRTCSLEGKNMISKQESSSRQQTSTTSMIPRLEKKKLCKKGASSCFTPKENNAKQKKEKEKQLQSLDQEILSGNDKNGRTKESPSQTVVNMHPLENKLDKDFNQFKQNILKIPEFWSDADQTVKNILKNAVGIVTKQYPTANVEAFELEIQNILKATEAVKQEILNKTRDIVNQANKIYGESSEMGRPTEEELKLIAQKMEELKNNVTEKNNAFTDLLLCGTELKCIKREKLLEINDDKQKDNNKKNDFDESKKLCGKTRQARLNVKKSTAFFGNKKNNELIQSCGDILRQDAKAVIKLINDSAERSYKDSSFEDKSCQTMSLWASDIVKREESLKHLNNQILELHNLCKDHITKFKSFNFQIKLRGMCNKTQNVVPPKDIEVTGKNKFSYYNKELDYAIKQRDVDVHQKNRLINQQKKLLHVREELMEMLKSRCHVEVEEI